MSANQPICKTCGVLWVDHMGIQGTCAENSQLRKERDELRQQVENIKNGFEGGCYLCEVVGEMNKRLQKERDEARRVACKNAGILRSVVDPNQDIEEWANYIAKVNKWDCYKEETT